MLKLAIRTGADLKCFRKEELLHLFGKSGNYFYNIAHCKDDRPVITHWIRKSIGKEITLKDDVEDTETILSILKELAHQVEETMQKDQRKGFTITLKVKYFDFKCITRSMTITTSVSKADDIMTYIPNLLQKTDVGAKKVRLLGISVSNLLDKENCQGKYYQLPLPFEVVESTCKINKT
jgi:DNA polymerase-4